MEVYDDPAEVALYCTRKKVNNSDAYPKTIKRLYSRISDYEEQQQQQQFTLSIKLKRKRESVSNLPTSPPGVSGDPLKTFHQLSYELKLQVLSELKHIMLQRIDQLNNTIEIL
uniref:Uncharacterized protein n=1 Tax=Glossina pallidipes TaxID=7398 RepID=A0A1A9ZNP1_GLOPL